MRGHWIRSNGYVRVPTSNGGGDPMGALIALGVFAAIVIFLFIYIKTLDKRR